MKKRVKGACPYDIVFPMTEKARIVRAWIASVPGVGPKRFESLVDIFPNLEDVVSLSEKDLVTAGIPQKLATSIGGQRTHHSLESIQAYCASPSITVYAREDKDYPRLLKEIADPPIVLYVQGNLPDGGLPTIGVVGTRRMTQYGQEVTHLLTSQLVADGFVIVSGFMYGVDACAHRTALDLGGKTIGVLGFGFDYMYPHEHAKLASEMIHSGNCLVTEFPPWQPPVPGNFPSRNRIVSGMSLGILVTEAASKRGIKITARLPTDQGHEFFPLPQ